MKKLLLVLSICLYSTFNVFSQCIPDPSIPLTASGIFPDSAQGFVAGTIGIPYSQLITVVVPADTVYLGFTVQIDSIGLQSYSNLPPGLTLAASTPSHYWHGGTKGCAIITGTPTTEGSYKLQLTIKYIAASGLYTSSVLDTDYVIVITPDQGINNIENSFNSVSSNPNPFSKSAEITFNNSSSDNIVFSVYNLVGKIIHQETIIPQTGFNRITYTPSVDITQGIYLYKLNNGKQVITKRFIYSGN